MPLVENVGVSFGTLCVLGLSEARVLEAPTTAHFLIGQRCVYSCRFCAQARCSTSPAHYLSRITWPERPWEEIKGPLLKAVQMGIVKRICVQLVETFDSTKNAIGLVREIRSLSQTVPISVCMVPSSVCRVRLFIQEGVSRVGLPIDAVSSDIHEKVKGRDLKKSWSIVEESARQWPGRISTHFICGLGETEEEMVKAIERAENLGITVALFAFTPIRGTPMENHQPPDVSSYRRVQIASYFLRKGGSTDQIEFEEGQIVRIDITQPEILKGIYKGYPFETSGCPDCNRPYYNERPGRSMMNFPRKLSEDEALACVQESKLFEH